MYTLATRYLWSAAHAAAGSDSPGFEPMTRKEIADALTAAEGGAVHWYTEAFRVAGAALVNAPTPEADQADRDLAARAARKAATYEKDVGRILLTATDVEPGPSPSAAEALASGAEAMNQKRLTAKAAPGQPWSLQDPGQAPTVSGSHSTGRTTAQDPVSGARDPDALSRRAHLRIVPRTP